MFYNTSYRNKSIDKEIDGHLGESYGLIKTFQLRGKGSGRMLIEEMSQKLFDSLDGHAGMHFTNIEQRPKGILLFFKRNTSEFTWAVPFHHLSVFKTKTYNIHAQGQYVKLRLSTVFPYNEKFLKRMLKFRNDYMELGICG